MARDAEEAVAKITNRVNDGFFAGQITRSQVASWALINQAACLSEQDIRDIHAQHFDEVAMLEALLKRAKGSGEVSPELRALLQKQMGLPAMPKKSAKKSLHENSINDVSNTEDERRRSAENPKEVRADS